MDERKLHGLQSFTKILLLYQFSTVGYKRTLLCRRERKVTKVSFVREAEGRRQKVCFQFDCEGAVLEFATPGIKVKL